MERPYTAAQLILITLTSLSLALGLYWIVVSHTTPGPQPQIQLNAPARRSEQAGKALLARRSSSEPEQPRPTADPAAPDGPKKKPPSKKQPPEMPLSQLERKARKAADEGQLERAERLYKKLVRAEGRRHLAALAQVRHRQRVRRGDRALAEGQLELAALAYQQALKEAPSIETERKLFRVKMQLRALSVASEQQQELAALVARAHRAEAAGKLRDAVRLYGEALALSANPGPLKTSLGKARVRLVRQLELRKQRGFLERGKRLLAAKKWDKAYRAYRRAASLGPLSKLDQQQLKEARRQLAIRDMVRIPAGKLWLGSKRAKDEQPVRQVALAAFYIDRYELTNAQYARFVRATHHRAPSTWPNGFPRQGRDRYPVCGVSLDDALAYARWVGKRLPTELEWERAARGNDQRVYPWGSVWQAGRCNTLEEGMNGPTAVGSYRDGASLYGVHDLLGNALEWTASGYQPYAGARGKPKQFVLRGGCWYFSKDRSSVTMRYPDRRTSRLASYGFRCALDAR